MARKKPNTATLVTESTALAYFAAKALAAADPLSLKKKKTQDFPLDNLERAMTADLPGLSETLKKKLKAKTGTFTVADTAVIAMALAITLLEGESPQLRQLSNIAEKLLECLHANFSSPAPAGGKAKKLKQTDSVYQFKITLLGERLKIWRRIQVQDCTLDKFHEHIQTAMGWTNSHLYLFSNEFDRFGDPDLLNDGFHELECLDSTTEYLSDILPKSGDKSVFHYDYDFGDEWRHAILFEGQQAIDPKAEYPLCLEGEGACPPEDCGGVWGYVDFLEAIGNPTHDEHEDMLDWVGGRFDPDEFDAKAATMAMRKGFT